MRRPLAAGLAALWLAYAAPASADVGDYLDRPIASVTLEIDARVVRDAKLVDLVETRAGEPLAMADVRESLAHLFSLGRFEDVRVDAVTEGDRVALTYILVPLHAVSGVDFAAGGSDVDEGRLRRLLTDRFGSSPRPTRARDMARVIEEDLRARGYLRAAVTAREDREADADSVRLVFDIAAGVRARVGTIRIRGESGLSESDLLDALDLEPGIPFEREPLTARIERYIEQRRRRGFYEARLTLGVQRADEDQTVNLTLDAAQGPLVRLVFTGDPIPENRRDDLVPVAREGSTDEDLLEDASNRIEAYFRAQGYRDATAPHTRAMVNGELHLRFDITRGALYRVARVEMAGNGSMPAETLQPRLRVRAGQPFSASALEADVEQIEDIYHRDGFAAVEVTAEATPAPAPGAAEIPVDLRIQIAEGIRTVVDSVDFEGVGSVARPGLGDGLGLQPGRPFFAGQLAIDRDALELRYANLGYPDAVVSSRPGLSADGRRADVVFTVREGARIFIDHVLIVGNERTRTATIERELLFEPGDPLGLEAINESQRRLASLGLFRRVRITELGHGDGVRRDVLVTVEEAPVTTIGYGGGIEVGQRFRVTDSIESVGSEHIEFTPRAFFEIGRRNLFGKNRSVNLFTRVSLRSSAVSAENPGAAQEGGADFSEYRIIGTFREPRVAGTGSDAFVTGTLEQQARSTFNFSRRALTAEIGRRVTPRVSLSGSYQIQRTELFDERIDQEFKLLIDRAFPQVRLSSFSLSAVRDTRDDLTDPLIGTFLSANGQVAGREIGSEVGFWKTYLTAQAFHPLPRARGIVLAASARFGFARGFPRLVPELDGNGEPVRDGNGMPIEVTSRELPASERFFAGGDTTVRGFSLDQLGTPETIDKDGFPNGGRGLVILNAELRIPVRGGLGLVGFLDAGNVFAEASDIDLASLRSAAGFGVRYKSPIGPIRVDVGFKTSRRTIGPGKREAPAALHISLGQAF
jgi:outer membrane protein assembly complex protein YaeT